MPNSRQQGSPHAHMHAQTRTRERRQRLAHEAARLMAEGGIRDYHQAKLKAAQRLGIHDDASLPRNREIEDALREIARLNAEGAMATMDLLGEEVYAGLFDETVEPDLMTGKPRRVVKVVDQRFLDGERGGLRDDGRGEGHDEGRRDLPVVVLEEQRLRPDGGVGGHDDVELELPAFVDNGMSSVVAS